MATAALELIQFHYSHFNEKIRWALDYKRIAHRRRSLLPGPHAFTTLRTTGQTQVPVLRVDAETVTGSAAIIDALETRFPEPALYPADAGQRKQALEIQRRFDDETGPMVRCALFAGLLGEGGYVCDTFAHDRGPWVRRLYRASFPLVGPIMRRGMGISGPVAVERAIAATREALDFVAHLGANGGPLVGDAFSVADLTAASLLAPAVMPAGSPMELPFPHPAVLSEWLARWSEHPGAAWVRTQYARNRHAGAAAWVGA